MIQEAILIVLVFILLTQIGVLRVDTLTSMFGQSGYESDDEIIQRKKKRHSSSRRNRDRRDKHMTPISKIIQERRQVDPDDPEEIQRAIMDELNHHDSLFLTPTPI